MTPPGRPPSAPRRSRWPLAIALVLCLLTGALGGYMVAVEGGNLASTPDDAPVGDAGTTPPGEPAPGEPVDPPAPSPDSVDRERFWPLTGLWDLPPLHIVGDPHLGEDTGTGQLVTARSTIEDPPTALRDWLEHLELDVPVNEDANWGPAAQAFTSSGQITVEGLPPGRVTYVDPRTELGCPGPPGIAPQPDPAGPGCQAVDPFTIDWARQMTAHFVEGLVGPEVEVEYTVVQSRSGASMQVQVMGAGDVEGLEFRATVRPAGVTQFEGTVGVVPDEPVTVELVSPAEAASRFADPRFRSYALVDQGLMQQAYPRPGSADPFDASAVLGTVQTITLADPELVTVEVALPDGQLSAPGYRFTNAEGLEFVMIALTDEDLRIS